MVEIETFAFHLRFCYREESLVFHKIWSEITKKEQEIFYIHYRDDT